MIKYCTVSPIAGGWFFRRPYNRRMEWNVLNRKTALVIVDMQKYYLSKDSAYFGYFTHLWPDSMNYIIERCGETVIPNIKKLYRLFMENSAHVIFLKLCGTDRDRNDLHRFFRETNEKALSMGYENVYPLRDDPMSSIIDELAPGRNDKNVAIIHKTTYSAFTSSDMDTYLREKGISTLVFTGLATSQCVETTARDASERGYATIHIEDAQADYDEVSHRSSLYSSQGVCGGLIYNTSRFINYYSFN